MKGILVQEKLNSKRVVFEPGNFTRYDLLLTKVDEHTLVITDINNGTAVTINPEHTSPFDIEYRLKDKGGYSSGDANPMAEYIYYFITKSECVTYETADGKKETKWYEYNQEEANHIEDYLEENGYEIAEEGSILR